MAFERDLLRGSIECWSSSNMHCYSFKNPSKALHQLSAALALLCKQFSTIAIARPRRLSMLLRRLLRQSYRHLNPSLLSSVGPTSLVIPCHDEAVSAGQECLRLLVLLRTMVTTRKTIRNTMEASTIPMDVDAGNQVGIISLTCRVPCVCSAALLCSCTMGCNACRLLMQ
jgi:hypothetical protein